MLVQNLNRLRRRDQAAAGDKERELPGKWDPMLRNGHQQYAACPVAANPSPSGQQVEKPMQQSRRRWRRKAIGGV